MSEAEPSQTPESVKDEMRRRMDEIAAGSPPRPEDEDLNRRYMEAHPSEEYPVSSEEHPVSSADFNRGIFGPDPQKPDLSEHLNAGGRHVEETSVPEDDHPRTEPLE